MNILVWVGDIRKKEVCVYVWEREREHVCVCMREP